MIGGIEDAAAIREYLERNAPLHVYELGDLDPFFWPATTWWGLRDATGRLEALVLVYRGPAASTVIALDDREPSPLVSLLSVVAPRLPDRFHAHVSPGVTAGLDAYAAEGELVPHLRMSLVDRSAHERVDTRDVRRLDTADRAAVETFLAEAYPGNWFDPRMLETGEYVGVVSGGRLVAVAGVHVVSARTRVAALGNIATHPAWRGRGLARAAVARLVASLSKQVDTIGLNVSAANVAAVRLYEGLGFGIVARYDEGTFRRTKEAGRVDLGDGRRRPAPH